MPEYVPKLRLPVRVAQAGVPPIEGWFALAPQARFHAGPETLLERLSAGDRVVPILTDGSTLLVSRAAIQWVEIRPGADRSLVCPASYRVTREERVEILLDGGTRLE